MGGFFGTVSQVSCVTDLFYGTDYNSHLGTKRGGLATYSEERGFIRSIHNLESTYFRTKFEDELDKFKGNAGIGIISDTDAQPIIINSHLGRLPLLLSQKSPILKNWKMSFSRRICISPNLVQATPIRRNLLHYLSYKAKLLSRVSKMYSSISKVLVPCFC